MQVLIYYYHVEQTQHYSASIHSNLTGLTFKLSWCTKLFYGLVTNNSQMGHTLNQWCERTGLRTSCI